MRALYILLPFLCIIAIAYRYYSAFIAAKVMALDDSRLTPAHAKFDGHNYYPTSRWVLFWHHFAAITGAGPLLGPVLAAQFGFAPGFIWLIVGVCLAGAVHDFTVLWASTRRGGRSLAEIARTEIDPIAGVTAAMAVIFIVIIALAGLGIAVVNALAESAWATSTIGLTIPLAVVMGFCMFKWTKGKITQATIGGVIGMILCVVIGERVAASGIAHWFILSKHQLTLLLGLYGFAASVLPVWMLLTPRDYLSTFMKISIIGFLVIGVLFVNPQLQMPAISQYAGGAVRLFRSVLPLLVHHDRLRRHFGLPWPDLVGHDAQDGGQGSRPPSDRLRGDALRGPRRRYGAHRRHGASPGATISRSTRHRPSSRPCVTLPVRPWRW